MESKNILKNPRKLVAYYRVSTKIQQRSGLGLEAQKAAVAEYARQNGGIVIAEYTENGKPANGPIDRSSRRPSGTRNSRRRHL